MTNSINFLNCPVKLDLHQKLRSEEFKNFLKDRLSSQLTHPLISQERILVPNETGDRDGYFEDLDEFDEFGAVKDEKFWAYRAKAVTVGKDYVKGELKNRTRRFRAGVHSPIFKSEHSVVKNSAQVGRSINFYHDGVIAGGAIAALANEFLFGVPAVINDIDYFYYSNCKFDDTTQLHYHMYENLGEGGKKEYKIKETFRQGDLNFIKISPIIDLQKDTFSWVVLLNSFDLNCTMIAVHPVTFEVFLRDSFVEFLASRKIDHSRGSEFNLSNIIRAKRKSQELQATYYLGDYVRKLLIEDIKSFSQREHFSLVGKDEVSIKKKNKNNILFLSEKEKITLNKNPNLLSPYLSYTQNKTMQLSHKFPVAEYFKKVKDETGVSTEDWGFLGFCAQLTNKNFPEQEVPNLFYEKLLIIRKIIKNYYRNQLLGTKGFSLLIKQDFTEETLVALMDKMKGHSYLYSGFLFLLRNGWTFKEIDILYRRVLNNASRSLVGILEEIVQKEETNYRIEAETVVFNLQTMKAKEILAQLDKAVALTKITRAKNNKLREKENLGYFNKFIKELTTRDELDDEGHGMKHCVGGYAERVKGGTCRIFHLQFSDKEKSTLELRAGYLGWLEGTKIDVIHYEINQNQGPCNQRPSEQLNRLAKMFVKFLNQKTKRKIYKARQEVG